jgi:two-component system OmpR family sensor kinase
VAIAPFQWLPLILLLGALGSYWLAARAFIPIDRLTRTTQYIQMGDLHQRVPIPRTYDEVHRLATTLNEMIRPCPC